MNMSKTVSTCLLSVIALNLVSAAEPIKHKFLLKCESRKQLHYVDENDPSQNWTVDTTHSARDIQLIGNNQILLSERTGYDVVDLKTRKTITSFRDNELGNTESVRRKIDGTTVVGANKGGITVFLLDKDNKITQKAVFPELKTLRLMRLSAEDTVLLAEENGVTEIKFDKSSANGGTIVRRVKLPHDRNAYQALKTPAGNYLLSGGYAHAFFELKPDGTIVRELTMKDLPQGMANGFYAGFHVLKNGDTVVANWTGHGAQDSVKGYQLVQFNKQGEMVWKWHDPEFAGTAVSPIILDDISTDVLNDDFTGLLGPVK